jgi:integrase
LNNTVDAATDDAKGIFYIFYSSGLLTIGTVRSEAPSNSIKRRYYASIQEAVEQLSPDPLTVKRLHHLSREDRGQLYDEWIQRAKTPGDMSAALSALDLYFIVHFDVEPARVRSSRWEAAGLAVPQIIWPHEQQAIADAVPRCARTPAISSVASCLVELARQRSFRPSDVTYATLGDVHVYGPSHVVIDVRRHRGHPAQKTEAAEHPLEFLDAEKQIPLLKGYVEQELGRGRGLDEPLWGATSMEAKRNFRDAWALINQLVKAYTGDPKASIYGFRHTWFSTQLEQALMPRGTHPDRRIVHRIAEDGGHLDATTSITWYFHLPMTTLRAHADIALESLLDPKLTKKWSALSMDAIYQRVSRSKGRGGTPLVDAIRDSRAPSRQPHITQLFPCQPLTHEPTASRAVSLTDVLTAVAYVDAHRQWWKPQDARGPLNDFELRVAAERRQLLAQYEDPAVLVNVAQEKLASLNKYLQLHGTSQAVRKACSAFEAGQYEGYIDLEYHESLLIWLALLVPAGIRPSRLVIRMVDPTRQEIDNMINRCAAVTGMEPCIDKVCSGYSRPRAYLLLSSQDIQPGKPASSSATHMGGFNSLMVAAAIRLRLIDAKDK